MRLVRILTVVVLARSARADDVLVWRGDRSTCLASRADIGDLSLPDSSYELGPMRDPVHAGWAALDAGCGRSRFAIRADTYAAETIVSLPLRIRLADDWTAYTSASVTMTAGASEVGNTPSAVSRRVRALSPWGMLTTVDVAVLAPTSTSAADRAIGLGAGAALVAGTFGISALSVHATTAFDVERTLQSGRLDGGGSALIGAEVFPFEPATFVIDLGQRIDREGYHVWGTLGVRMGVTHGVGFELAASRDRSATSGWFSLYLLRGG
jgi:hypothetical protein